MTFNPINVFPALETRILISYSVLPGRITDGVPSFSLKLKLGDRKGKQQEIKYGGGEVYNLTRGEGSNRDKEIQVPEALRGYVVQCIGRASSSRRRNRTSNSAGEKEGKLSADIN